MAQYNSFPQLTLLFLHWTLCRASDKACILSSKITISSPNPMFDHLLESSLQDDYNEWSSIDKKYYGDEIM